MQYHRGDTFTTLHEGHHGEKIGWCDRLREVGGDGFPCERDELRGTCFGPRRRTHLALKATPCLQTLTMHVVDLNNRKYSAAIPMHSPTRSHSRRPVLQGLDQIDVPVRYDRRQATFAIGEKTNFRTGFAQI